jgi:hypothetical protein
MLVENQQDGTNPYYEMHAHLRPQGRLAFFLSLCHLLSTKDEKFTRQNGLFDDPDGYSISGANELLANVVCQKALEA